MPYVNSSPQNCFDVLKPLTVVAGLGVLGFVFCFACLLLVFVVVFVCTLYVCVCVPCVSSAHEG